MHGKSKIYVALLYGVLYGKMGVYKGEKCKILLCFT